MLSLTFPRRALGLSALFIATAFATGCDDDDDPVEPPDEPEVATIRMTIGAQTVTVDTDNGTVTGGPILVPVGGAGSTITAEFLRADGQPDPVVTEADFVFRVFPADESVLTYTETSAFEGTLTGLQAGPTTMDVDLFHIPADHAEFGPFPIPVTVTP
jgi:hypothetical protein